MRGEPFTIVDVSGWTASHEEGMGSKAKVWLGYTLAAVAAILADCGTPPGWAVPGWSAYEVFAGYLMLDALIANQDRHASIWDTILVRVPKSRLSDPARTFASEVLTVNRGRLLDACDNVGG